MAILSIITITFNAEHVLRRTLRSVQEALRESGLHASDVEYLLIDGASMDATRSVAQAFGDMLTSIVSEPDEGLYDAMNKGLRLATGTYVWFLNAGDELYSTTAFRELLDALATGVDIVYSDAMYVDEAGRELGLRSVLTPHRLPPRLTWRTLALGMKVCHQAFVVRRAIAPYYWVNNLSADVDWQIRCLKQADSVRRLATPLCRYLIGGLSVQKHRQSLVDRYRVLRQHFGFWPNLLNHVQILVRAGVFWGKKRLTDAASHRGAA